MLTLGFSGRILVAVEPVDGRKGIDSLAGVVPSVLLGDPLSGDRFVFKNRRGNRLRILAWMGDGLALYLRRLKRGTFAFPTATDASVPVTPTQLAMILGGLDPAKARERRRYKTPGSRALAGTRSAVE
jgi:transposase